MSTMRASTLLAGSSYKYLDVAVSSGILSDWMVVAGPKPCVLAADDIARRLLSEGYTLSSVQSELLHLGVSQSWAEFIVLSLLIESLETSGDLAMSRELLTSVNALINNNAQQRREGRIHNPVVDYKSLVSFVSKSRASAERIMNNERKGLERMRDVLVQADNAQSLPDIEQTSMNDDIVERVAKSLKWKDMTVQYEDLIEIFSEANATPLMPYIAYHSSSNVMRKLYSQGDFGFSELSNKKDSSQCKDKPYIRAFLWLGEENDPRMNTLPNMYAEVLVDQYLHVIIDTRTRRRRVDEDEIMKRIADGMVGLEASDVRRGRIEGSYSMWNVDFHPELFYHLMFTNDLLAESFYIIEGDISAALYAKPDIQYREVGDEFFLGQTPLKGKEAPNMKGKLTFQLKRQRIEEPKIITLNNGDEINKRKGTYYLEVIVDGQGDIVFERFKTTLDLAMRIYNDQLPSLLAFYNKVSKSMTDILLKKDSNCTGTARPIAGVREKSKKVNKYQALVRHDPELFEDEFYEVLCPKSQQPNIDENAENRDEAYLCNTKTYPCLDVVQLPDGREAPCCQSKKVVRDRGRSGITGGSTTRILHTSKVASVGMTGYIPNAVRDLLVQMPTGRSDRLTFIRRGIDLDDNALFHAVLACVTEGYYKMKQQLREKMAADLRAELLDYLEVVGPGVCLQEMVGVSIDEAIDEVRRGLPLSDTRYYRWFEERFDCNIFTFRTPANDTSLVKGSFHLPDARGQHIREFRHRPCILLLYNISLANSVAGRRIITENMRSNERSSFGHYEIITDMHEGRSMWTIQDAAYLYKELMNTYKYITWKRNPDTSLQGYINPSCYLNLHDIFGVADCQMLDENNHTVSRLYYIEGENYIVVDSIPSQPDEAPVVDSLPVHSTYNAIELMRDVIENAPSYSHVNEDGNIQGLYFSSVGMPDAIYIAVEPTVKADSLPDIPIYRVEKKPLTYQGQYLVTSYRDKARIAAMISEMIKWIYDLYRCDALCMNVKYSVEDFYYKYVQATDEVKEYQFNYYMGDIPTTDPDVALKGLYDARSTDGMVQIDSDGNYVIVLGNQEFYERVFGMLLSYERTNEIPSGIKNKRHLNSFFYDSLDFNVGHNNELLIGDESYNDWVSVEERNRKLDNKLSNNLEVITLLRKSLHRSEQPYVYRSSDGMYYYVHNLDSQHPFHNQAWNAYYQWNINQVVIANDIREVDEIPPHAVYHINEIGNAQPHIDETRGSDNFCRVLDYQTFYGDYAVMLPLGITTIDSPSPM